MQKSLLILGLLATGVIAGRATITIEKKTEIWVGEHRQLADSNAIVREAVSTIDGGYLAVTAVYTQTEVKYNVQRFSASGQRLWTQTLPIADPVAALACRNGELLFLAGTSAGGMGDVRYPPWRLVRTSGDGTLLGEVPLPMPARRDNECDAVVETEDGFLVIGSIGIGDFGLSTHGYAFVRKFSSEFRQAWERPYGDCRNSGAPQSFFLAISSEDYLVGCEEFAVGIPIYRIGPEGTIIWKRFWTGDNGWDHFHTGIVCGDGGFLLGASSETKPGSSKSAEHYGSSDFWLVKVSEDGTKEWDRSYGGTGEEQLTAIIQTDDGGFLVAGSTFGSGITGNKGSDGDGGWLLKLNSQGIKEAEMLFSNTVPWPSTPKLLLSPGGYRQAWCDWIADLLPLRKVRIEAKGSGKPYNLHVSSDLMHWTPMVINFSGDFSFEELIDVPRRFYRVMDSQ
ncbi:MAG: hypothetical protein KA118_03780 [Verrucomicrobia bacterium]|nr:hypothetical protein [Verrucomicrobiota bacterium]